MTSMIFWLSIGFMIFAGLFLSAPSFFKNRSLALSILILIPLASLIFYLSSGRYTQWRQYLAIQEKLAATHSDIHQFGQPKTLILQLEEKTRNSPNDPKAWYFLGKLYLGTGQLSQAEQAFQHAKQLDPDNTEIGFFTVQTAFFRHQTLNKTEKAFLTTLLQKEPHHLSALNLLALNAYQHKNYGLAIQYWEQILKQLPSDAIEERKSVLDRISQTKKKQG